ncbi:DUF1269 domain-containing protein [Effusibacillus dendaii]|uniref:DUF1269 domain-containing protein n=1 Tax=Effusibacillus dendaii TaxID=2743772 RepID=A0A7I8DEL4_9BACL|nr:DUF1269 domain-containing protein [Effusibacillus dendaii]BCJ88477.1 hypothetical protein skT53_34620 [Effusibacillus dendaii]
MKHLIGSFDRRETAESLIQELSRRIPKDKISLITKSEQMPDTETHPKADLPIDGGLLGAAIGGAIGIAFAAGSALLPGGSPLITGFGPLFGALYGGMSGGIVGGLVDLGINPTSAKTLTEAVESGSVLVSAEISEPDVNEMKKIFAEFGADHIAVQD